MRSGARANREKCKPGWCRVRARACLMRSRSEALRRQVLPHGDAACIQERDRQPICIPGNCCSSSLFDMCALCDCECAASGTKPNGKRPPAPPSPVAIPVCFLIKFTSIATFDKSSGIRQEVLVMPPPIPCSPQRTGLRTERRAYTCQWRFLFCANGEVCCIIRQVRSLSPSGSDMSPSCRVAFPDVWRASEFISACACACAICI
mmetsp:Transcript_22305/g.48151  ORF Transcript_22305/g.48151 Transcript_22305/m.48151 type:complete len:205 (-) Transcript_22305:554-1168(-)